MIVDETTFEPRIDPEAALNALRESRLNALRSIKENETGIASFQQAIAKRQSYIAMAQVEVRLYEDALKKLGATTS